MPTIRCFVIMPFSRTTPEHAEEYWTGQFEQFLKPLIETVPNVEAFRSKPLRGDILRQIVADLVSSPIVVADLTDSNPNVYWELGVRQSFRHSTVTIAENGTKLPFDLGAIGTLFYYPRNHLRMPSFESQFKAALDDCLRNPDRPDSHVLESISGRGSLFEIFRRDETLRRLQALLKEIEWNDGAAGDAKEKLGGRASGVTGVRLRTASTELLVANRYLDEENEFYKKCEFYLDFAVMINEQLTRWSEGHEAAKKWLMKQFNSKDWTGWTPFSEGYKKQVQSTYQQIRSRA